MERGQVYNLPAVFAVAAASIISHRQVTKSRDATTPTFLAGTFLLLCALIFYYFAVLKTNYRDSWLLDFGQADATEYFAQAKALLKDGYPYLQIGDAKVPSVYPFGYPVLMLPWLRILPQSDSILAPYRTNQTIGLLLILAVFGFYAYLAMPLAGGVAALMLTTLPGFFTFCRSPLSEISATTVVVLAFMFAYLGWTEERRWKIYLSAVLLGLALSIRLQLALFAPLLLTMAVFPAKGTPLRWCFHCFAVVAVFILAASPLLVLNTIQFHSPFKTGYDYWFPSLVENHRFFSFEYIPTNLERLWRELVLRPLPDYFVAQFYGTGTCFVPAFIFLACAGLFFTPVNRFVACALLACFSFLATPLSFLFSKTDVRFYLPLLVLLIGIAVLPVIWAAKNLVVRKRLIVSFGILILFTMACLGYPSRSRGVVHPSRWRDLVATSRSQMWDALHFNTPPRRSVEFVAQRRFVEVFGRQPGIVLSDISSPYLNVLLPAHFVAAPIDGKGYTGFSKIFQYDRPQAAALVKKALAESLTVYALFGSKEEMHENAARLPQVDSYVWIPADDDAAETAVLRLSPE